ncbi:MAG: hypothetical protein AB1498_07215 [bacterium]
MKTHSGSTAIQVGFYKGKRFKLAKHIGSSKEEGKICELIRIAEEYVHFHNPQLEFNFNPQSEEILFKRGIKITESYLWEAYEYLNQVYRKIGFNKIDNSVLKDFAIIRVLEPASKSKSIELLQKYFGIRLKKTTAFRELLKLQCLKENVEDIAVKYAKENLGFDFTLVFYDVTTLYFETHTEDDFRKTGFSKDNKINQPQILIGLVVNEAGFPIYYDIFKGNTVLYEYSTKRAKKDKSDNDKQLKKAEYYLKNPSKAMKRSKFLTSADKNAFKLNETIIEKHRLLEGIKGYKTNIENLSWELLIERYKDLWKIEQSFRIAKTDLEARPIYHRKKSSIEYHILIVFVALCMTRVIEMEKGKSIRKVVDELKDKWTITLKDEISGNSLKLLLDKKPH